uniref:Uncharacterized protein n=1 Tax=Arundo donax TaxID=35708 RepID=A0A0A8Y791_ARUDO
MEPKLETEDSAATASGWDPPAGRPPRPAPRFPARGSHARQHNGSA